jgi:putative endonuclease
MSDPRTTPWRTRKGTQFELIAAAWLQLRGLQLVERNYRCKLGELDLVMLDGELLVFVEVRYRAATGYGSPLDTIDHRKRQRLWRSAQHYLLVRQREHGWRACRFDVLGISNNKPGHEFTWLTNVFC